MSTSAARVPVTFPTPERSERTSAAETAWDDVPSGPVPAEVLRYFEEAIAREEARAARRALRDQREVA